MAPVVVWLIGAHGWRSAFVVFAVLTRVTVLVPAGF